MNSNFKSIYNQLIKEENDNSYYVEVPVSVIVKMSPEDSDKYDYESNYKAKVKFDIDIEYRSWGIKRIDLIVSEIEPVSVILLEPIDMKPSKTLSVYIDPSKIEKEVKNSQIVTVASLDLYIDINGKIDYSASSLEIYQPKHSDI